MQFVSLLPDSSAPPVVHHIPNFTDDRLKSPLVDVLVLKVVDVQEATPIEEGDDHHLLAVAFMLWDLRLILLGCNPLLVLSPGTRLMQVEPHLIRGDHPSVKVLTSAPPQKILTESPSLHLLSLC